MYNVSGRLDHDQLVAATVREMRRQGMAHVRASHIPTIMPPEPIGGYIPDTTAYYGGLFCVAEAESAHGLTQQHTASQWNAFFSYASRVNGYFIAVVARADKPAAEALLRQICGNASNAFVWTF